ncbi:hypothetical protein AAG906_010157 [Vitis piasezkii]
MIAIPTDATVRPLLIESRSAPAYCCLIDDAELDDGLPWYHDIYHFLRLGVYPEAATTKDRRALRQLATRFVICGETLYRRSADGMLLLCLDRVSADRVMREVHAGVCGPHMGGHMLAHVPSVDTRRSHSRAASELHAPTSPWPFSWGIDIIGKISLNLPGGHEFILVAIDYFTKWFHRSHIICRYGVPHELISDRGVHFERGATPYSLVYGMEAVLPVEIEMRSLRVALEQQIPETDWAQARFDQLNLLDERRLRAADHVRAYQRKMARAFKKRVKPRPLHLTPEGAAWLMDLDGNQPRADQCGSPKEIFAMHLLPETLLRCYDSFHRVWITVITCLMRDDLMSPIFPDLIDDSMLFDLRPIIHFDAIQGHISAQMRFTDHEGVACLSLFARCM